jgi:hypothetical protein
MRRDARPCAGAGGWAVQEFSERWLNRLTEKIGEHHLGKLRLETAEAVGQSEAVFFFHVLFLFRFLAYRHSQLAAETTPDEERRHQTCAR